MAEKENRLYSRHRWPTCGAHGLAKTLHSMGTATRRRLENMKIQALLTAIAINLKSLALAILVMAIHAFRPDQNLPTVTAQPKFKGTSSTSPGDRFSDERFLGAWCQRSVLP
ncbi:MAG: hypothetical protein ACOH2H_25450 [Cypionkella sp.]